MQSTDAEIQIRDTAFMEYCAKFAEESENPVPVTTISRSFVKANSLQFSELYFISRFKKIVKNISETKKYSLEKKAKICFVTSIEIGKNFLKTLEQNGHIVKVDNRNRITSFKSKDGRLIFEGVHSNSGKKRKHNISNFRCGFSVKVIEEEAEKDESLDGDDCIIISPNRDLEESHDSERAESLAKRGKQESVENVEARPPAPASPRVPQAQRSRRAQLHATERVKQENVEIMETTMPSRSMKQEIFLQNSTNTASFVSRGNKNDRIAGPSLPQIPEPPVSRPQSTQIPGSSIQGSSAPALSIVQQNAESSRSSAQLGAADRRVEKKPPGFRVPAPGTQRNSQVQEQKRPPAQVGGTDSMDEKPARTQPFSGSNEALPTAMHASTAVSSQPSSSDSSPAQLNLGTKKNFYIEFSKSMYYFLVNVGGIQIPGLQDLYQNALDENKGQDLKPSTIRSYFETCLDKISLDRTAPNDPIYLNRFLKKLLKVVQESSLKELELDSIISDIMNDLKIHKLVQKASVQKAFTEMMDGLKARSERKLRLGPN